MFAFWGPKTLPTRASPSSSEIGTYVIQVPMSEHKNRRKKHNKLRTVPSTVDGGGGAIAVSLADGLGEGTPFSFFSRFEPPCFKLATVARGAI